MHIGRNSHLAAQHNARNIFRAVGDPVLHGEQFEQVGTGNWEEEAFGEMEAQLLFYVVGLVFKVGDAFLYLLGFGPVIGDHRLKEMDQFTGGLDCDGHVFLHGFDRRTAKEVGKRISNGHIGSPLEISALKRCTRKNVCAV